MKILLFLLLASPIYAQETAHVYLINIHRCQVFSKGQTFKLDGKKIRVVKGKFTKRELATGPHRLEYERAGAWKMNWHPIPFAAEGGKTYYFAYVDSGCYAGFTTLSQLEGEAYIKTLPEQH